MFKDALMVAYTLNIAYHIKTKTITEYQIKALAYNKYKSQKTQKKPEELTSGFFITSSANLNLIWGVIGE